MMTAHDLIGSKDNMSTLIGGRKVRSFLAGQSCCYVRKVTLTAGGWNGLFTFMGRASLIAEFSRLDAS